MVSFLRVIAMFVVVAGAVSCASVDRSTASEKEEVHKVDRGSISGRY